MPYQLAQVQATLSVTTQEADRENLLSLQSDIQELIALTKKSLQGVETSSEDLDDDDDDDDIDDIDDMDDPMEKEYALFKVIFLSTSKLLKKRKRWKHKRSSKVIFRSI